MPFILFLMRIFVGGVFVYSGWEKLSAPIENFMAIIEGYQFLKPPFISIAAHAVPWLELIFGAFLALGFLTRTSTVALACFLMFFIGLLLRSLLQHLPVSECGCFGSGIVLSPKQALILDSGLLMISLVLIGLRSRFLSLDEKLHRL